MVTKGLKRWKIIASKTIVMMVLWTLGYWSCYGITYGYNAYFWDNSVSSHLVFAASCFYLIGIWLITLVMTISAFARSGSLVVLGTGGVFGIVYLLGLFPDIKEYLSVQLMVSQELLVGVGKVADYRWAILITCVWIVLDIIAAMMCFDRKEF